MAGFKGFPEGKTRQIPLPVGFFRDLLPQIDHLNELKVIVYFFYRLETLEGGFRFISRADFEADEGFISGLGSSRSNALEALEEALALAVKRGVLLEADTGSVGEPHRKDNLLYFLNSPKGRAALRAIQSGQWHPAAPGQTQTPPPREAPNVFRLYEENIGPLTPLLSETLTEAEDTYPAEWIEDAIRIAVERNKRTWRYVAAILERWQREGKYDRKEKLENRQDSPESRRKYVEGDYSDFVEH